MNTEGTVSWFENPASKVSAHAVLDRGGNAVLFNEWESWLWHAGVSTWADMKSLNRYSIGFELVGTYSSGFTPDQISCLAELSAQVINLFPSIQFVLGHEQIAPGRKVDPGPNFPWGIYWKHLQSRALRPLALQNVGPLDVGRIPAVPTSITHTIASGKTGDDPGCLRRLFQKG